MSRRDALQGHVEVLRERAHAFAVTLRRGHGPIDDATTVGVPDVMHASSERQQCLGSDTPLPVLALDQVKFGCCSNGNVDLVSIARRSSLAIETAARYGVSLANPRPPLPVIRTVASLDSRIRRISFRCFCLTSGISRGAHSVAGRRRLHAMLGVAVRQGLYAQFPIFAGLTPMLPDANRTVLKSPEPIPPRRTVME